MGKAPRFFVTLLSWALRASTALVVYMTRLNCERGEDYRAFKDRVEETMFAQFRTYFPELAELVVFRNLSTPLTTASITGHHRGAFYGLGVTPERVTSGALQVKTPVQGLLLSGQDVVSPGVPGAFWGGVLAAVTVDPKAFKKSYG